MGTSSDMLAASQLLNSNVNLMGGMASLGFPYGAGTMTATGPSTLFVFNLNPDVSETDLWQLFGPYGGVQNVKVGGSSFLRVVETPHGLYLGYWIAKSCLRNFGILILYVFGRLPGILTRKSVEGSLS